MLLSNIVVGGVFAILQILPASALPGRTSAAAAWRNATSSSTMLQPERRSSFVDVDRVDCFDEWWKTGVDVKHETWRAQIKEGIQYLKETVSGHNPELGPGICDRVSCSWNSAIIWCNEDPMNSKELPGYSTIAEAAEIIVDRCNKGDPNDEEHNYHIMGRLFMKDHWSVTIHLDKC
ncbi:hypothetical protein QBC32DRAFT_372789 [Pseudoneurospora amorphoporcata]|uniref:Ecp2 effector protein domain-containing protein n=1 Tax=Pseudoneurospora amorphoporcata TaxID=241081 RepID=A0AAN6SDB0_9PEZI|nr:hypothetical protein QBC32DRAFT_372789 [Pseudoneurospora amorphoporcata]